jgi:hypothetical protein
MMLQEAKSIARHLGLTLRQVRSGAYRVNFRDGNEATAYYADNLEDAVNTAVEMVRTRQAMEAVDEPMATRQAPGRLQALSNDELWQLYEAHVWRPRDRQLNDLDEAILAEIDRRAETATAKFSLIQQRKRSDEPSDHSRPAAGAGQHRRSGAAD